MQKYRVTCTNYVFEDSYHHFDSGEEMCYDTSEEFSAEGPIDAVRQFYNVHVSKPFDPKEVDEVFDGMIHDSELQNSFGEIASAEEIKRWEAGEINLYRRQLTVMVELVEYHMVDLEEALKNS